MKKTMFWMLLLRTAALLLAICLPYCLSANVNSTGQFTTQVPIVVPPFHGLEPNLSLVYGSSPANGWIGAGWELSGGPSYIVRASRGRGAPRFDGSDIFLLDGMELIPCSPASTSPSCTSAVAAFGNSNGFYSTKIENFQRIQYAGANNTWVIWTKNGTQRLLQADPASSPSGTLRWVLRSETDTHGNQVLYGYGVDVSDQPPITSYLSSISYNSAANVGVRFYSAPRPDTVTYGNGLVITRLKQRLLSIDISDGLNRVRVYALSYHTSASTSGSLLDGVQMFGRDATVNCGALPVDPCDTSKPGGLVVSGTSMPPMTLQYDETATATFRNATTQTVAPSLQMIAGDFNGDGKTDYLSVGKTFNTYLSNGDGTFTLNYNTPIPSYCNNGIIPRSYEARLCFANVASGSPVVVGDFNGDGKTDFIAPAQNLNTFLSNGDGTFRMVSSPPPSFCSGNFFAACLPAPRSGDPGEFPPPFGRSRPHALSVGEVITGDFNGDGKTDFLVASDNFYTFLSNGDGTFRVVTMAPPSWCGGQATKCLSNQVIVGDFDGDGKTDFLSINANFDLFRSNGDGTFTWIPTPPPASCTDGTTTTAALCGGAIIVGDFNGDGKTDFATAGGFPVRGLPSSYVFLSDGNGSFTLVSGAALPPLCSNGQGCLNPSSPYLIIGDFNGDGKTDFASANQNFDVWISLGDGNFKQVASTPPPPGCISAYACIDGTTSNSVIVGDFNGDGKTDFLWSILSVTTKNAGIELAVGGASDHLIGFSNGMGAATAISYTPSSNYSNTYLPAGGVFQTVAATTISDTATGSSDSHTYKYSGGLWDAGERRFLGFGAVTETMDAAGDYNQSLYAQTSACSSQPLQTYLKDSSGSVYDFSVFSYVTGTGPPPYQCLLGSRTDYQAERTCKDWASCAQNGARAVETDFKYDSYGNVLQTIEQGDLSVQGDERTTSVNYISPNVSAYIVALPCERQIFPGADTSGQPLRQTIFVYDGLSAPCQATKGDLTNRQDYVSATTNPVVTKFAYDTYGNQTSVTDANNHTSTKQFDPLYNLYPVQTCNALRQCSILAWDGVLGKMSSATDANRATSKYSYDVLGRLVQVTNPDGGTVQYAYQLTANASGQPTGQLTHQTASDGTRDGLWTDTYTDGLGRTYRIVKKGGYEKDIQYSDSTANPSQESGWYLPPKSPPWTRYSYDGARRLITTTNLEDASRRSTTYSIGKVSRFDELGQDTAFYTDAYGRTTKVQEHNGSSNYPTTTYTYDVLGELTQTADAANNYSHITWDMLGRRLMQADPDMGAWNYTYDLVGNVRSQTDGKGQQITFTYDPLNRVVNKTYPDGSKVVWKYDEPGHGAGIGRLTSITEVAGGHRKNKKKGSDSFSYDSMGRMISSTKCRAKFCFTSNSVYDKVGRLAQLVYPDHSGHISAGSETLAYGYNDSGRLSSLTGLIPYVNTTGYDPDGQVSSITYGNGAAAQFSYDFARRWLNSASVLGPGSPQPTLYAATYSHDPAGHIGTISSSTNQLLNLNFTYDPLGRLTQVSGSQTQQFTYDNIGNMTSNSAIGTYSYGVPQVCSPPTPCFTHPHAVTAAGNSTYTYDANGNMTSGAGRTIRWNDDNLPLSVTTSAGTTTFDYDASSQRVSKNEPGAGSPTYYFSPLVERTPNGDVVYSYYAGPMLVARRTASTASVVWYHQDHLASVRLITDDNANVTYKYDYAAFGVTLVPAGDPPDPYGFTGQLRNPSTSVSGGDVAGLIYMNARYYDATLGRFISADSIIPDPMNPQSLNRYSYVCNNPVSFNDRTGHATWWDSYEPKPPPGIGFLKMMEEELEGEMNGQSDSFDPFSIDDGTDEEGPPAGRLGMPGWAGWNGILRRFSFAESASEAAALQATFVNVAIRGLRAQEQPSRQDRGGGGFLADVREIVASEVMGGAKGDPHVPFRPEPAILSREQQLDQAMYAVMEANASPSWLDTEIGMVAEGSVFSKVIGSFSLLTGAGAFFTAARAAQAKMTIAGIEATAGEMPAGLALTESGAWASPAGGVFFAGVFGVAVGTFDEKLFELITGGYMPIDYVYIGISEHRLPR